MSAKARSPASSGAATSGPYRPRSPIGLGGGEVLREQLGSVDAERLGPPLRFHGIAVLHSKAEHRHTTTISRMTIRHRRVPTGDCRCLPVHPSAAGVARRPASTSPPWTAPLALARRNAGSRVASCGTSTVLPHVGAQGLRRGEPCERPDRDLLLAVGQPRDRNAESSLRRDSAVASQRFVKYLLSLSSIWSPVFARRTVSGCRSRR